MSSLWVKVLDEKCKEIQVSIKGYIVADYFGIHHLLNADRSLDKQLWSITHLPTGLFITYTDSYRDARAIAARLTQLPINWLQMAPETLTADQRQLIKHTINYRLS